MSRVLVMGLGRFGGGVAAARWFLGAHAMEDFERAEVVVVNPAVPFDSPFVERARARGAEIVTEMGLTLRRLEGPVIAITGTNGKSTTAALAAAMLAESGLPVALGGNIGHPLLNETGSMQPGTVAVLEISSFQLFWLEHDHLAPAVAVITNVSGDHFDRHPDFAHYAAAKRRLAESVSESGLLILREEDPVCREFAETARGEVAWFGADRDPPVSLDGLRLSGHHNRANAAAAAIAALRCGATPEGCTRAAGGFRPLPHRLEPLGEREGVLLVDDSVSTSPVATAAAVSSFSRPVILLTGGRDKGLELQPLLEAAGRAREVIAYGESGPALRDRCPRAHLCEGLDDAVHLALRVARPGDVVLLSPGFASYDEFPGFDARGARFRELVAPPL
ncbi:MAG: UDP-N-acetylmuramoyl-L-alanine--D-glutamate ligase [Planctomycetota bacterium]